MPALTDLVAALPDDAEKVVKATDDERLRAIFDDVARRPIPTGALRRLGTLGSLQAKIALAYAAYGIRGWFQGAEKKEQSRAETHLSVGLHLLESMSYLRGAIMKVGQLAANFPDIVPDELTQTLGRLHFQAPPMHFSLLREQVENELKGDINDIFYEFDTYAVAAASLGQVHRARLKSGEEVAVKVQYPGIARSIRSDLRNLTALMLPLRLGKAWKNLRQQFDEIRQVLEAETDYEKEAANLRMARSHFGEDDQIVIPKVYEQFSTRRVLTMEWIDGRNFEQFLESNPDQAIRSHFGSLISRSVARLYYAARTLYADPHPGNLIFMEHGRLGLIDFGCMRTFNDVEWDYVRLCDMAMGGGREAAMGHVQRGIALTEKELADSEFIDLIIKWCEWSWEPNITNRDFDYGDPQRFRRGIDLFAKLSRRSRPQSKPVNLFILRWTFANYAVLYRLKSCFNVCSIVSEERRATGWGPRPGQQLEGE